jgi:hypothetical protein
VKESEIDKVEKESAESVTGRGVVGEGSGGGEVARHGGVECRERE